MTESKNTKRTLHMSVLALVMCVAMLIGTTYAWFTDSVTSGSNIIKSGNLDVTMEWAEGTEKPESAAWKDASEGAIFNYDLWEPGYTEVKHIKIANAGNLAFKYTLEIVANGEVTELADVIDVYYVDPAMQITSRMELEDDMKLGTLTDVIANIGKTVSGSLLAGERETLTLALKMQESAGNEYQNMAIGSDFTIILKATQDTVESDSFDNQYDAGANKIPVKEIVVTTPEQLADVFNSVDGETVINATDVTVDITEVMANGSAASFEIPAGVTIKGATFNPTHRGGNYIMMDAGADNQVVFENCNFGNEGKNLVIGSTAEGPDSVVYNNCTFTGPVITNFVDNPIGVAEFNNCTFTKATSGIVFRNYVEGMGGTHNFNKCTFDYTGVTQSSQGVINSGCVNVYSEAGYSTTVVLNECTRINCGTRTYGPNSTLTIK